MRILRGERNERSVDKGREGGEIEGRGKKKRKKIYKNVRAYASSRRAAKGLSRIKIARGKGREKSRRQIVANRER